MNLKSRKTFYSKEIDIGLSDRFSVTQGRNLLFVAWDDYDGEIIASHMSLDKIRKSIFEYVHNSYHLEEE